MPRTRIRGRSVTVAATTTGGTQVGPANASSYTADVPGDLDIVSGTDTVATPTDVSLFDIALAIAGEANTTPTETSALAADVVQPGETASTPTGAHTSVVSVGATTVTQTVGTGWQTPANAQGLNDNTNATINAPAALGGATVTGTLVGSYASIATPTTETATGTITLTFYRTVTIGTLASGSLALAYSTDGGTNYTTAATLTATATGTTVATITGVTLATLANLRFRAVASHTPSATGASGSTLDAVVVAFTFNGNNAG